MARTSTNYRRRRRGLALAALVVVIGLIVFTLTQLGGTKAAEPAKPQAGATATPKPKPLAQLPRGGGRIFPDFRVVAYYGAPQDAQVGGLGIGSPAAAARKLVRQARGYQRKSRQVLPAMELIAVVAANSPGDGGRWNIRQPDSVIRRYLKAARKAKM